ncbi:MAG: tetratricopeptide repeat protein [Cyclobacteriaceae bacterium]
MKRYASYIFSGLLIFFFACANLDNPLSTGYNDLTAHFNSYFIAKERMKEIETAIHDRYEWNYNKVLPIYPQFDTTDAKALETEIKDCIEKASISIQRHPDSKWEDDAYVLVGKARYYSVEFPDAIETFKYVNKHSKDKHERHKALIQLLKTFVEYGEFNNAIAVSDYLSKEKLNNKNLQDLYLCRAYLYQKRNDKNLMVQNLVKAEELMTSYSETARVEFIIGQVYQELGFDAEAYHYYERSLKNNPDYELSFYTKLNMAQVTELTSSGDIRKVRKYFRKLLKDTKNTEYKDKIYYEMANFELKQGNLNEAIDLYKMSIQNSVQNQRQKGYAYLKLGQIYYDSLKQFELAQAYYDSTVSVMPKDEEGFEKIRQRQEILDDFVVQVLTIRENDSLLVLSNLPKDSVLALATSIVEEKAKQQEEDRKKEAKRQSRVRTAFDQQNVGLIQPGVTQGAKWYFYNPTTLGRGASEFKRVWGSRPLEDDWRRSNKTSGPIASNTPNKVGTLQKVQEEDEERSSDGEVASMVSKVPFEDTQKEVLKNQIEEALYKLGFIYNFKLEEKENAITTFEQLNLRFPKSTYRPEILYQLYLLYKTIDSDKSFERANQLKAEYPETIYARLVDNPNYTEESHALTEELKIIYNDAYRMYSNGLVKEAQKKLDSALILHPENDFSDNLKLLQIMCTGILDGQYRYQYELNNFMKDYSESELKPYAQQLAKHSEDYQIKLFSSSKAKFSDNLNQKHYSLIVYANKSSLAESIPSEIDKFIKDNSFALKTGNLILDEKNAMVMVNEFPGKGSATKFVQKMNAELTLSDTYKGETFYYLAISEDNFDVFYQTKDLDAYLNFFEKNY